MDDENKAVYEERSKNLRAELKRWENEWAQAHDGKKPGRQDIKDNADIARKYKDYNKYRDILSGKIPPPSSPNSRSKKRQSDPAPVETPLKRAKYVQTPSKQRPQEEEEFMSTPAISRKLFSPAPVTSLGPTPQRDGRVLGLFDLLVEKELGTPSRRANARPRGTPSRAGVNSFSTPSRRTTPSDAETAARLGRTPTSAGRKQMVNMFATPTKARRGSIGDKTPSSVSKLQFDTPAFLKRHSLPAIDEGAMLAEPAPLRLPRKPLMRGLSEIVASLRKVEEEVLDDDLDALREIENEATTATRGPPSPSTKAKKPPSAMAPAHPSVLEPDSQGLPLLLGGFDNEEMYDSAHEDGIDRNGNPVPVYKKKGQKRTTRKANIKPTMKRRPQAVTQKEHASGEDDDDDYKNTHPAPDTQVSARPDGAYQDEPSSSQDEQPDREMAQTKKGGPIKKAARKVNELAHTNFKRLKLRNYGAKGGPGFGSRFRRR